MDQLLTHLPFATLRLVGAVVEEFVPVFFNPIVDLLGQVLPLPIELQMLHFLQESCLEKDRLMLLVVHFLRLFEGQDEVVLSLVN